MTKIVIVFERGRKMGVYPHYIGMLYKKNLLAFSLFGLAVEVNVVEGFKP